MDRMEEYLEKRLSELKEQRQGLSRHDQIMQCSYRIDEVNNALIELRLIMLNDASQKFINKQTREEMNDETDTVTA